LTKARFPAAQSCDGSTYLELKDVAQYRTKPKITRHKLADACISWHFVPNPSR